MVLLLMSVTVLQMFTLAMLFIATMEKSWWIWSDAEITDLWSNCIHYNVTGNWLCAASNENDRLQAVQSLMVLSVVFSSISFLVFLGQLFTMSKGGLFYFTGLCQVFADRLQAVQSLMVLSVVFSSISFLVFLGQLFTMSKGGLFYFTGLCQVFAGFTSFAACLIFTFHRKKILEDSRDLSIGHFGYCFILAWSCVPLLLFSGVLYVHLRKRQ